MDKRALVSAIEALDMWVIGFGVIVALGVTGEAVAGFLHWRWGNQLRVIQDEENRAQQKDIDTARLDAARAAERAAEANRIAEEERLARVKIEERMAPRSLSPEQRSILVGQLKSLGRQNIAIVCSPDPEPLGICSALMAALKDAGWTTSVASPIAVGASIISGMLVEAGPNADDDALSAAGMLVSALNSAGLAVSGPAPFRAHPSAYQGAIAKEARITLTIGPK
jgi:hypothetical protein